ncbi:hypothetical protein Efla_002866 [Eimeria flavescens]
MTHECAMLLPVGVRGEVQRTMSAYNGYNKADAWSSHSDRVEVMVDCKEDGKSGNFFPRNGGRQSMTQGCLMMGEACWNEAQAYDLRLCVADLLQGLRMQCLPLAADLWDGEALSSLLHTPGRPIEGSRHSRVTGRRQRLGAQLPAAETMVRVILESADEAFLEFVSVGTCAGHEKTKIFENILATGQLNQYEGCRNLAKRPGSSLAFAEVYGGDLGYRLQGRQDLGATAEGLGSIAERQALLFNRSLSQFTGVSTRADVHLSFTLSATPFKLSGCPVAGAVCPRFFCGVIACIAILRLQEYAIKETSLEGSSTIPRNSATRPVLLFWVFRKIGQLECCGSFGADEWAEDSHSIIRYMEMWELRNGRQRSLLLIAALLALCVLRGSGRLLFSGCGCGLCSMAKSLRNQPQQQHGAH